MLWRSYRRTSPELTICYVMRELFESRFENRGVWIQTVVVEVRVHEKRVRDLAVCIVTCCSPVQPVPQRAEFIVPQEVGCLVPALHPIRVVVNFGEVVAFRHEIRGTTGVVYELEVVVTHVMPVNNVAHE